jgi:hypothetical protein
MPQRAACRRRQIEDTTQDEVGLRTNVLSGRGVTGLQRQSQQGTGVKRVFVVSVGGQDEPVVKRLDHRSSLSSSPAHCLAINDRFKDVGFLVRGQWRVSEQVEDSLGFVLTQLFTSSPITSSASLEEFTLLSKTTCCFFMEKTFDTEATQGRNRFTARPAVDIENTWEKVARLYEHGLPVGNMLSGPPSPFSASTALFHAANSRSTSFSASANQRRCLSRTKLNHLGV